MFAIAGGQYFHLPAHLLGIAGVHAKQITGKDSGFVATGAGANFKKYVFAIVGILGQQQDLQFIIQQQNLSLRQFQLFFAHFTHLWIGIVGQCQRFGHIAFARLIGGKGSHHVFKV